MWYLEHDDNMWLPLYHTFPWINKNRYSDHPCFNEITKGEVYLWHAFGLSSNGNSKMHYIDLPSASISSAGTISICGCWWWRLIDCKWIITVEKTSDKQTKVRQDYKCSCTINTTDRFDMKITHSIDMAKHASVGSRLNKHWDINYSKWIHAAQTMPSI